MKNFTVTDEKTFRTREGECHILPDRIVFTGQDMAGGIQQMLGEKRIPSILFLYLALFLGSGYKAYESFQSGQMLVGALFLLCVAAVIYAVIAGLYRAKNAEIHRQDIQKIELEEGIAGLTVPRFTIWFRNNGNQLRKRMIILPGTPATGPAEADRVIEMMKAEDLLK